MTQAASGSETVVYAIAWLVIAITVGINIALAVWLFRDLRR